MKDNRNPAGDKWQPGQSLQDVSSWQDVDITHAVPENLTNVGTPTSELPPRVPEKSLLGQHPFPALVFDTEIYLP
jgi:hypothetical protein